MENKSELMDTILDIGRQCLFQRQEMSIEADISQMDFVVIDVFKYGQRISCKELSETMRLSSSRCSRIIERLQRKGYVERKPNSQDRRAVEVSLTRKGMFLKEKIEKLKTQCEKRIFGAIKAGDIEIVKKGMRILRKSLMLQH